MLTQSELEVITEYIFVRDLGRGVRLEADVPSDWRKMLTEAIKLEFITPARGTWGHRLTKTGKLVMSKVHQRREELHEAMRGVGLDPYKPIVDLTDKEIEIFKKFMKTRIKVTPTGPIDISEYT